jgi:hypothetical protein
VHLAAFEPEKFRNGVAVWDGKVRRGKDWDAFCDRNVGKELLTENQYAACLDIQRAVRASPAAMRYIKDGTGEAACLWTRLIGEGANRYRFECKGRLDYVSAAIVDLKTTKDVRGPEFARQVVGLHYDAQAAWYTDGYEFATGERKPYVIVAVENVAPFDVVVYRVPEIVIDLGREKYMRWLDRLAWSRENNRWPGYANDMELELELPAWALPKDDEAAARPEPHERRGGQGDVRAADGRLDR